MFFVFYLAKNPTIYLKYIRFYNFFDPIIFSIKTFSEDIADKNTNITMGLEEED